MSRGKRKRECPIRRFFVGALFWLLFQDPDEWVGTGNRPPTNHYYYKMRERTLPPVTSTLALLSNFVMMRSLPFPTLATEGGVDLLEILVNFLVSFVASVAGDYVSRWLERHGKGKQAQKDRRGVAAPRRSAFV